MIHTLSKSILACLLGALALCAAGGSSAQTGTGGTTTTASVLSTSDFTFFLEYYDPGQKQWTQMNSTQQQFFFNRARCECDGDTTNWSGYFKIAIQPAQNTSTKVAVLLAQNLVSSGSARLYAGGNAVNCLDPNNVLAPTSCLNLIAPGNQAAGIAGGITAVANPRVWESDPIPATWLFNSVTPPVCTSATACNSTANCGTASLTATIYIWAQTTSLLTPDLSNLSFNVNLVGENSYAPNGVTAQGENEALVVNWGWPSGLNPSTDPTFMGVQLFCVRGQNNQVFPSGTFGAAYMTSATLCPATVTPPSSAGGFAQLDPSYLCSGLLPTTATSYRITGLQNGIPYGVGVAAVDKYGNISSVSDTVYASPIPSTEQGGSCELAGWHGRPGALGSFGLLGIGLLIALRMRSRSPATTVARRSRATPSSRSSPPSSSPRCARA